MRSAFFDAKRVLIRGTAAGLASAIALIVCSRRETGSPFAAINAVSHWAWGDADARRDDWTWRHTALGALTHEVAAIFWAICYERMFAKRRRRPSALQLVSEGTATSALACAIDYTITPKRFTPGYELRLSKASLAVIYMAFATGLVVGSLLLPADKR